MREHAATFRAYRQIIDRLMVQHEGRVFGSAGDSVIAEFASPVEAVRCATEIQLEVDRRNCEVPEPNRLRFRIGINLGDVVVEGDNLMGDGVNVAARLEALSRPGGICVSEAVHAQARDRLSLEFVDLGEHKVKNIARPCASTACRSLRRNRSSRPFAVSMPSNSKMPTSSSAERGRLPPAPKDWSSWRPAARHSC